MKSNYKKLGQYIRQIKTRNKDLQVKKLIGLSTSKKFIPSIANTIGTNMRNYRVIKKNQFAYCPVTSRNNDRITVSLNLEHDIAIVSQAYPVFEVINPSELHPEYLMMWFRRPEFDRYARFKSHGSAREIFNWEELCNIELPVPSIEKQRAIVKEYNTVINRIKLNEQLNQKLEETAQALYRHWFVDFEFPDENGKPYKSSGGEMVWNEELEKEIPEGWTLINWGGISTLEYGKNAKGYRNGIGKIPVYGTNGQIGWTTNPLVNTRGIIIGRKGAYRGVHYSSRPFHVIDTAFYLSPKVSMSIFWAYYELTRFDINEMDSGSAIPSTSREDFYDLESIFPTNNIQEKFEIILQKNYNYKQLNNEQNEQLIAFKKILLSKLTMMKILE